MTVHTSACSGNGAGQCLLASMMPCTMDSQCASGGCSLGVGGLAFGGIMGVLTLGQKNVIDVRCNVGGDPTLCHADARDAVSSARTYGLLSTVGFVAGLAGVGTAAVLFLTEPARPRRGGARARALRADVLAVGQGGAVIGVQGGF